MSPATPPCLLPLSAMTRIVVHPHRAYVGQATLALPVRFQSSRPTHRTKRAISQGSSLLGR
eukprot:893687-Lingulodinium_polyedra.AAC.1